MSDQTANEVSVLDPGAIIGSYAIVRHIGTHDGRNEYLIRIATDEEEDLYGRPSPSEPQLRLIEGAAGTLESIRAIEALQLRHPRLLALRDFLSQNDRDYAVVDLPGDTWPLTPPAPITAAESLAVGVIIGEVLSFLHGRGVAHTHVVPENIVVVSSGIFLAGIENAIIAPGSGEAQFRQDANHLAVLVGSLTNPQEAETPTGQAVAGIATRGSEGAFTRLQEVMAECLRALPDGLPELSDAAATAPMSLEIGHATSVGRVREQNQDSIGVLSVEVLDDQLEASPGGIFLVADGMGGEAQGEVASRIAARMIVAEVARRFLAPTVRTTATDTPHSESNPGEAMTMMQIDSISALVEAFRAANTRIRNMAKRLERAAGTTTTALMLFGHEALIGHVGDSRAYLLRGGELIQLTVDHSLVQRLIELGQYHPDDSSLAVPRNYLYRSLGQGDDLEVDTRVMKLGIGDVVMMCSDGVWDLVSNEQIREVMASDRSANEIARELVNRANAAGGHDNSTVVVVRLLERQFI
jgi:PPM family protein phosphatase